MSDEEVKNLKQKRKEIIRNIEVLDKKMRRGQIGAAEYFKQFDNQKEQISKIKQKIKELEQNKGQELTLEKEENLVNLDDTPKEEGKGQLSLTEKIKSYIPKGLKIKLGPSSSEADLDKTENAEKKQAANETFDIGDLRKLKFFQQKHLTSEEHPNFIHLTARNFLEDLGYKIVKIKKPLPETIEFEQDKFKVFDFSGYLTGNRVIPYVNSKEFLSIYIKQEGICSIVFDGQHVKIHTRAEINIAGNSGPTVEKELENDIIAISEKLNIFLK